MAAVKARAMLSKSTIKYIQSLQHKKFRDKHHAFVAEGPKVVRELLLSRNFQCTGVFALPIWLQESPIDVRNALPEQRYSVSNVDLQKISSLATPNQVVAVFAKPHPVSSFDSSGLTIVLDDLQDPGNLGTIIRTAHWFGIRQLVCSPQTADQYSPKVVQSSMASLGKVNVLYTEIPEWLPTQKAKKYGATLRGENLRHIAFPKDAIIIIGNESKGISSEVLSLTDLEIGITGFSNAESLNASIAASIVMYEFTR